MKEVHKEVTHTGNLPGQSGTTDRNYSRWLADLGTIMIDFAGNRHIWRTLVMKSSQGLEIFTRRSSGIKSVGRLGPAATDEDVQELRRAMNYAKTPRRNVVLRLSSDQVLRRTIELPAAARDVLEPVLRNQLERIGPWPEQKTRFGYKLIEDGAGSSQIRVEVAATSKKILDEALSQAKCLGLTPELVDVADRADQTDCIKLIGSNGSNRRRAKRVAALGLGALVILMLVAGGVGLTQMIPRHSVLGELEQQVTSLRATADSARRSRIASEELWRQRVQLVKKRKSEPSVAVLVDMLSRILPDDTYLTRLEINNGQILLSGKAGNSTGLIAILEKSPLLTKVRFSSSTLRNSKGRKETFSIEAHIKSMVQSGNVNIREASNEH